MVVSVFPRTNCFTSPCYWHLPPSRRRLNDVLILWRWPLTAIQGNIRLLRGLRKEVEMWHVNLKEQH